MPQKRATEATGQTHAPQAPGLNNARFNAYKINELFSRQGVSPNAQVPTVDRKGAALAPKTIVTTVEVKQHFTTYSTSFQPMAVDGASSFVETQSITAEPISPPSTPYAFNGSGRQLDHTRPNPSSPSKRYSSVPCRRPASRRQDCAINRKPIAQNQIRKTRLPWLDGSQGRRGSMPPVPGAFLEEVSANKHPLSSSPTHRSQQTSGQPKSLDRPEPVRNATARADILSAPLPQISSEAAPQDLKRPPHEVPAEKTLFLSDNNHSDSQSPRSVAVEPSSASPISTGPSSPKPLPVLATARGLYQTDSSAFSDSEISMKGDRRRALADSVGISKSGKSLIHARAQDDHLQEDQPSPTTVVTNKLILPPVTEDLSNSFLPTDRKLSMAVQPVRPSKVTITADDLPADRSDRQRSISVQPIKSRSLSSISTTEPAEMRKQGIMTNAQIALRQFQNIQNSITGLESLMQEAMKLARQAAENDRADQVPEILNEARFALHRASIVQHNQQIAIPSTQSVGCRSSGCSGASTCSSGSSQSFTPPQAISPRLELPSPTVVPSSRPHKQLTRRPPMNSRTGSTGPQAVWNEDWQNRRVDVHSSSIDWAYAKQTSLPQDSPPFISRVKSERPRIEHKSHSQPVQSQLVEAVPTVALQEQVKDYAKRNDESPFFGQSSSRTYANAGLEGASSPPPVSNEADEPQSPPPERARERAPTLTNTTENWGRDKFDEKDFAKNNDTLKGKHHITLKSGEHFSIHHGHQRQPIARNWSTSRKRFTAIVACLNTALVGILIGIYAGEVPAIQYSLADTRHLVIMGNVWLYIGMAITTFLFWPLPLLHGRKPYTLLALGLALPLQIPPAMIVSEKRSTINSYTGYVAGMLASRAALGLILGFAHINFKATLLDLYGASLQSEFPHGEVVVLDDVRRHGGGMGYWLGIWSFSFIGSLALGFLVGADVVSGLNLSWGFYISVILIVLMLFLNVITPETRRSPHRRTMQEVELPNDSVSRRVARGEIRMHVSGDGPKWWWEEVFAGIYLSMRMLIQSGFLVMALYLAWIYAEIVLIIVLLGNLLSAQYSWRPEYVGLGVLAIAVGALLAVPNSKANFFSRSRVQGPRTDSMTFQPRFTWTSHMVRRALFMTTLPAAGLAYTLASKGKSVSYIVPIVFAGMIGYVSNLAIAECNGIIMETFDTSDLQPGTNSKHRLQSLAPSTRHRRTTYSSYPRVSAGLFAAQSLGFLFAAAATGVGGAVTRRVGAQKTTAITAGILMGLTILLTFVLLRFRVVQVIPNELFATSFNLTGGERKKSTASVESDKSWRAVVIGSPSGKTRRMNWLELGSLSRWTEIRRLNRLLSRTTTQALNPGWK